MATENDLNEYINHAAHVAAAAYHAMNRDGSIPALGREMVNDIRATMMQTFFGHGERGSEPGTPMHPIFADIVEARNVHESALAGGRAAAAEPLPSPGEILAEVQRGSVHGAQEQGTVQHNIYGYERGQAAHGSVSGPEHGVYGPEHGVQGRSANAGLATPGQILAEDHGPHGPEMGRGIEVAQVAPGPAPAPVPGGFVEQLMKDGYQLERGKVLPDDQLENNKGRAR